MKNKMDFTLRLNELCPELKNIEIQKSLILTLGSFNIRVHLNTSDSKCLDFFSDWKEADENTDFDYEVFLIDKDTSTLENFKLDSNYRTKRFKEGYYITDHFGKAIFIRRKDNIFCFIGENLQNIFWPYFIKYILTNYSIRNNCLHLKGSSFEINNVGGLLIGRGGGGKTVLLKTICDYKGNFISNTHNLVKDNYLTGIKSNIRIRSNELFADYLNSGNCTKAIKAGDYNIDPKKVFKSSDKDTVKLKYIFIVNSRKDGGYLLEKISPKDMFNYMQQFSLAINVYGLKEDIIDDCDGNSSSFSNIIKNNNDMLYTLAQNCECYYVNIDSFIPENKNKFLNFINTIFV